MASRGMTKHADTHCFEMPTRPQATDEIELPYSSFRIQFDLALFQLDSRKMNPKDASSDWMLF